VQRVGTWAAANNAEIAYTPTNSSWLNRIEAQFTALRYFALDGTGHADHKEKGSMIRRYIIWRLMRCQLSQGESLRSRSDHPASGSNPNYCWPPVPVRGLVLGGYRLLAIARSEGHSLVSQRASACT
jgi:hypothetical protein